MSNPLQPYLAVDIHVLIAEQILHYIKVTFFGSQMQTCGTFRVLETEKDLKTDFSGDRMNSDPTAKDDQLTLGSSKAPALTRYLTDSK